MTIADLSPKSPEWHANRRTGIGGSDARTIMDGKWNALWKLKTGRTEPDDLNSVLPVMMGSYTEPLNLAWFQLQTGLKVTTDTREQRHPQREWMRCELDGMTETGIPVECKHVNAFAEMDEVYQRYYPQLQHQMDVVGAQQCYLSVFLGTLKYEVVLCPRDPAYIADLVAKEAAFWWNVTSDDEPEDFSPPKPPTISFDDMVEVEMAGNEWPLNAGIWLDNQGPAKAFKDSEKALKALVPDNARRAYGSGIEVKRGKNNALRIRKLEK